MQIRELPRGRQLSIKGNVVNVPVDIQPVVNTLPRPMNENITVAMKLKKKMSFQSCAFSENVRPLRVLVALHWLMNKSALYKNANIDIDQKWIEDVTEKITKSKMNFLGQKQHLQKTTAEIVPERDLYDSDAEEVLNENTSKSTNIQERVEKKQDRICRFGYPLPPLQKTMVLDPLENDKDKYFKQYEKIQKKMNDEKHGYNMSFENFLTDIAQMNEDDYIKCIRSSLNSSKVFLKRNPNEIRENLYNDVVLKAWKANTDIQFVLDPYACAMYIVSYISKSQRGMSNLMHAAAKEARDGNLDIKRQVRHIGNVFSNSVEVSAQEAVYLVLQMPLTRSTRDVVFINTSVPNQRVQLLKPKSALDELPAGSTDIMSDNIIKRYSKRPKALNNYCLADYVSQLEVVYPDDKKDLGNAEQNDDQKHAGMSEDEYFDDCQNICILKSGIKIRRRRNSKILRYVSFNCKTDEENYYREKLLLFYPWRNEERDLLGHFATYKEQYESIQNVLELARNMAEAEYNAYDEIAHATQQEEAETAEEEPIELVNKENMILA
ncbi:hypothetical protein MAR_030045 [Mya arenaria]|uniref:DUF6570 domain-containing protein n=1 Tax=Mya arenaria TaxID=6604 RepID=A0ABY7DQX3_MYAAR|nr:hypothetical protein MAR_030045 [Mya arenaria]